uniref:Uncharacterized protein n=1 Tax=Bactrocera dorsalis TaxID=27457 RepID=A0A034VYE3_BACDO
MASSSQYRIKMVSILSDKELLRYQEVLKKRASKKGKSKTPYQSVESSPIAEQEIVPESSIEKTGSHKVFMYLQLQDIINVPYADKKRFFISLRHNNTNYADEKELDENTRLSAFAIPIEQYNMDVANAFSDEPVAIILTVVSEEENDATEKTIAQGQIDLIHFFTNKRTVVSTEILLYPTSFEHIDLEMGTCKTVWHVYSLLPLMRYEDFNNMVFITIESIYNASSDIMDIAQSLGVSLSFRSKFPNELNEFDTTKICTFNYLDRGLIIDQDTTYRWASISMDESHNLGQSTDCGISLHKIFSDLLCTEGIDFNFDSISMAKEEALICNLLRRYILDEVLNNILEAVIVYDEQELIIEVYDRAKPDSILLRGSIDLSIFLYPDVNSCRFAVNLEPVKVTTFSNDEIPINPYHEEGKITFGIVNICILQPITECQMTRDLFRKHLTPEEMKTCAPKTSAAEIIPEKVKVDICEENYKHFDAQMHTLIDYIIRKEIQQIEDSKGFLCCQKNELTQKIMKLIACDFNIRVPTKNSTEFANLMTFVYKNLEKRCFEILQKTQKPQTPLEAGLHMQKIALYMSIIKVLNEVGAENLANIYKTKLEKLETPEFHVEGYKFLYNMEKQNFEEAREHLRKPLEQRFSFGDYRDGLFDIYITYIQTLLTETSYNDGLQYLLRALETYSSRFPKESSTWILLYCIYSECGYVPGMSYTRWKFENLKKEFTRNTQLPLTLWDLYCKQSLEFTSKRATEFYKVVQEFLELGLYKFAQIIFGQILIECTEAEKYFVTITLQILLREITDTHSMRTFQGFQTTIFQSHINGHLHYYLGDKSAAKDCYAVILHNTENLDDIGVFQMSILRYANYLLERGKYEKAISAYGQCTRISSCRVKAFYDLGRAYYRLGKYQAAEEKFSSCTNFGIHLPDVWGYLALANLKMNNTFKALESWKYAKINPNNVISEEIYSELKKIDLNEVTLIVDAPDAAANKNCYKNP